MHLFIFSHDFRANKILLGNSTTSGSDRVTCQILWTVTCDQRNQKMAAVYKACSGTSCLCEMRSALGQVQFIHWKQTNRKRKRTVWSWANTNKTFEWLLLARICFLILLLTTVNKIEQRYCSEGWHHICWMYSCMILYLFPSLHDIILTRFEQTNRRLL